MLVRVIKILLVLTALVLLLWALERAFDFGLLHNQNLKMTNVTAEPVNAKILVHGPCEPLWMIAPAILDSVTKIKSYNLALSHSDFADNYLHLRRYLQTNQPPDLLLLYVTPESMDRRFNVFNSYRFAPYLSDAEVSAVVKENDSRYYRWTWIPFMKYAYYNQKIEFEALQGFKHYFIKRTKAYYPDGFEPPAKRVWGNHQGRFSKLYEDSIIFIWDPLREKYLRKCIDLALQYRIKVLLYESPVLEEALAFQANRPKIISHIDEIAAEYKIPYVRFENLAIARDRKYFISTLNFNMEGLRIFNDTLGKFLLGVCGK
jgi:hypothetical protein